MDQTPKIDVVIVDDNPIQSRILSRLLTREGYGVRAFRGAKEALDTMERSCPPDLVITDVYMPVIDGWRFCLMLRSKEYDAFNQVPILVISSIFAGEEAYRVTSDLGANAFLASPVDPRLFLEQVRRLLSNRQEKTFFQVLIVEDDLTQALYLRYSLEGMGYQVDTAENAGEAAGLFTRKHYDLVLLDYHLTDRDGDQLLVEFQKRRPDCIYIMMTADPRTDLSMEWLRSGATACVSKPIHPNDLLDLCTRSRRDRALVRMENLLGERFRRLQMTEERYRTFFDQGPDGILVLDPDTGGFIEFNDQACRQLGYSRKEFAGLLLQDIETQTSAEERDGRIGRVTHGHRVDFDTLHRTQDGEIRNVNVTEQIIDLGDRPIYQCIWRDITQRVRTEEALRHSQKVEAVGRLASGIAHDMNNLLVPILAYGETLLDEFPAQDSRRQALEEIIHAGFCARDLVRQLLAFGRKQALEYQPVNINEALSGFEKLLRRTIREDIELSIVLRPLTGSVWADIGQIEQVIMNLAINAQDAMPAGGRLLFETDMAEISERNREQVRGVEPGSYVRMTISDTGNGMSKEIQEHIFEPFFSTKGLQGSGLGLATVQGIVQQHNGQIFVQSSPGKGTTFQIFLPVREAARTEKQEEAPEEKTLQGSGTIFLVEDSDQVRFLTQTILRRFGYTVHSARNGSEALQGMQALAGSVDLLLTDVIMPEMNGLQLAQQIRESQVGTKVLYMTGYSDEMLARAGVPFQDIPLIHKPFTAHTLAEKIKTVLSAG